MIHEIELQRFQDYLFQPISTNLFSKYSTLTVEKPVVTGVSQGSILGPFLYLIHFIDVALELNIIHYADDIYLARRQRFHSNRKKKLNDDMSTLSRWFNENEQMSCQNIRYK